MFGDEVGNVPLVVRGREEMTLQLNKRCNKCSEMEEIVHPLDVGYG